MVDDEDDDVLDELELAWETRNCPKCGFHLDLVRFRDNGESGLRCSNVKCRWECYEYGERTHFLSEDELAFLRESASTCSGCAELCWNDVDGFHCKAGLSLTTALCSRFVEGSVDWHG